MFELVLPSYQAEAVWPLYSDIIGVRVWVGHFHPTQRCFLFLKQSSVNPGDGLWGEIPVNQLFLKFSDGPTWHNQTCHPHSDAQFEHRDHVDIVIGWLDICIKKQLNRCT